MSIKPALEITPRVHRDGRGMFFEWYRPEWLTALIGHPFRLAQSNCSVSHRGVIRGIHFAEVPPGQAKYVTCVSGEVLDVVIDLRVGSPTFGRWEAVRLDGRHRRAIYVPEGIGHGFMVLSDLATVVYLCSEPYRPEREHEVDPLDPQLGIAWPKTVEPILSRKDANAPGLLDAQRAGLLPTYEDCLARYEDLRTSGSA